MSRGDLGSGHAEGAQEADPGGALDDRQGEGVDHAEDGDGDGPGEQAIDQVEHGVDLLVHLGLIIGLALQPAPGGWR
jgi:hypothetical protein